MDRTSHPLTFGLSPEEIADGWNARCRVCGQRFRVVTEWLAAICPGRRGETPIFAMQPQRPSLWLPSVPILPRRRPYIPSQELDLDGGAS